MQMLITLTLTVGDCDVSEWPDIHDDYVCGDCKVLVRGMMGGSEYKTCKNYCRAVGRDCVGAWKEAVDTCATLATRDCGHEFEDNNAICECGTTITGI